MSTVYSADVEAEALTPWSLTIEGKTFTAQLVSRPALLRFHAVMERAKAGTATGPEELQAIRALFRQAFPWRWGYLRGDPVAMLMRSDQRVLTKALDSFLASLAKPSPFPAPGTNGRSGASPSSEALRR